jgi:hypothetical protein
MRSGSLNALDESVCVSTFLSKAFGAAAEVVALFPTLLFLLLVQDLPL